MGLARGRLIPSTGLVRRLALQSLLFAAGQGAFTAGSAVFFTRVVGLTAAQVGLGLTIVGAVSFVVAFPAGKAVDRLGPRRVWGLGTVGGAAVFGLWPWIHGFALYVATGTAFEIMRSAGGVGYNAYVLDVLPEDERIASLAHLYSAQNIGFTLGAVISGTTLALDNIAVVRWIPVLSALVGVANFAWIRRLPRAPHDPRAEAAERAEQRAPASPTAIRNVGWSATAFLTGILSTNQDLLTVVIPLWLVDRTDAPRWVLAGLYVTNTVCCVFLPPVVSSGVHTVGDGLRRARYSTVAFAVACVIMLLTHSAVGFVTVLLIWLAHVCATGAELSLGSGNWVFQARLVDPERRGEYSGVAAVGTNLGIFWAPAAYTYLVMRCGNLGWLLIAAIALGAAGGLSSAVHAAERFAQGNFIHDH